LKDWKVPSKVLVRPVFRNNSGQLNIGAINGFGIASNNTQKRSFKDQNGGGGESLAILSSSKANPHPVIFKRRRVVEQLPNGLQELR
jgi:hypothetical protein